MKILATLTGGLDSTYWLSELLKGDDEIATFYIRQKEDDGLIAYLPLIVSWLHANRRPFSFEVVDVTDRPDEWPMCSALRYAAERCTRDGFDRFSVSRSTDNMQAHGVKMLPKYQAWWSRHAIAKLDFPLLDLALGRAHVWTRCPPDLLDLCVRCDQPQFAGGKLVRCGACIRCKMGADIVKFLAAGYSPDQIAEYHWKARGAWKYVDRRGESRLLHQMNRNADAVLND